jgi:mono/diheme cytochrome c family protein
MVYHETTVWFSTTTLAILLAGCSADTGSAPTNGDAGPPVAAGARMYSGNCIACHQKDALGIASVYPSLVNSPVVLGDPKELALWVIQGRRPAAMPVGRYPTAMIQFSWMKPADAAVLFTYLRSNFGNHGSAVDAATVAQALGRTP